MANTLAVGFGFVIIGVVLLAVLGAVERREKFAFVAGVVLLIAGPILVGSRAVSATIGGGIALIGVLAIVAGTVPLLRQPLTAT